jgi:hypothetical protein
MKIRVIIRWSAVRPEYARQQICNIFKQLPCRVTGHKAEMEITTGKLALKCARCGWESPGWTLDRPRFGQIGSARVKSHQPATV